MRVIKRDGRIVKFNPEKINTAVSKAMKSIGMEDAGFSKSITDIVVSRLEGVKEISVEGIQDKVEDALIESGNAKLAKAYILYRAERTADRQLKAAIGVEDDLKFKPNTLHLLNERYLKTINGKKETPSQMFKRVSTAVASVEKKFGNDPTYWANIYYNLLSNRLFMPSTPVLANGGGKDGLCLFACFGFEIEDSMESILQTAKDCGMVQKMGGGVGLHLSSLRPSGDSVKSTEGTASGPVSFMRVFDVISDVTKQGGIRRGGNLGLLNISHPDILTFIQCKADEHTLNNFNISVAITDEFMTAVKNDADFYFINPKNGQRVGSVKARTLFRTISEYSWRNGEPGMVFWDRLQKDNPTPKQGHLIVNLCGEQPLLHHEACCLGSINLEKFVDEDGQIVYSSLKKVVGHAVRFLDDVIETSSYPLEDIEKRVKTNRKIGLGVMGFANMLCRLGVPYDSPEAERIAEEVMDFINVEAHKTSTKLAEERGDFPSIKESTITSPMRNATLTTIAPTGTISMVSETSSGIEPNFAVVYQKTGILDNNTFFEVNPVFEEIGKKEGWYKPGLVTRIIKNEGRVTGIAEIPEKWQKVFRTALEISPEWHVRMQSAFQKHIDNSISKTVNLPNNATVEDVERIIKMAYDLNLKGLTVYRNKSRQTQILETLCPECESGSCPLPNQSVREDS